jgi:glutathione S-transferase
MVGDFFCGDYITIGDILLAPYFDRMCVLEHYRGFIVPETTEYRKYHYWKKILLDSPAINQTRVPEKKLIKYYEIYANGKLRNHLHYRKYFAYD